MILDAPSQAALSIAPSLLNQVVQALAQDQNAIRIKKLLIYACTRTWESDLTQIDAANWENLLRTLFTISPTPDQLRSYINGVASSLNKATEYTPIAHTIISHVSQLYPPPPQVSENSFAQENYQKIAQVLRQDPEQIRIKKLLVLACKNAWISDQNQLAQLDLAQLVLELYHLASTLESLQLVLANRVKKLSKCAEYTIISDRIVQAFQPLYTAQASKQANDVESTAFLSQLVSRSMVHVKAEAEAHPPSPRNRMRQQQNLSNLFDLRLEIIRYATPLRAKVLLFSLLHEPFQSTSEHHLMLKNHELDDLLRILIQTYRLFSDLETKLMHVARSLEDPEDYLRVAKVVLCAIQCHYSEAEMALKTDVAPETLDYATDLVKTVTTSNEFTRPEYS